MIFYYDLQLLENVAMNPGTPFGNVFEHFCGLHQKKNPLVLFYCMKFYFPKLLAFFFKYLLFD